MLLVCFLPAPLPSISSVAGLFFIFALDGIRDPKQRPLVIPLNTLVFPYIQEGFHAIFLTVSAEAMTPHFYPTYSQLLGSFIGNE